MTQLKDVPFATSIGVEFTYLHDRKPNLRRTSESSMLWNLTSTIRDELKLSGLKVFDVTCDECAVEICSPVFYTMGQMKRFWDKMQLEVGRYPLVTHREDTYSGAGHIHFGIPKEFSKSPNKLLKFAVNIFRDINNRPYLNWVFNEWANIQSAKSFVDYPTTSLFSMSADRCLRRLIVEGFTPTRTSNRDLVLNLFNCAKGHACRLDAPGDVSKPPTIEFRFFDMVQSFDGLRAHVNFVNRYIDLMTRFTRNGSNIASLVKTKDHIKWFGKNDRGLKEFRGLVKMLRLDPKDYEPMIELNYMRRKREKLLK